MGNRLYVLEPSKLTSHKDENQEKTVGGIRTGEKGRETIPSAGGIRSETDNAVQSASGWGRVEAGEKKEERRKRKKKRIYGAPAGDPRSINKGRARARPLASELCVWNGETSRRGPFARRRRP